MPLYRPTCTLSPKSITLLETVARLEGEIRASARGLASDSEVQAEASIDAIHFSTRIEGNALSREQVTKALTGKQRGLSHKKERDIKEVLNYSKARHYLFQQAARTRGVTVDLILEAHRILMDGIVAGKLKGRFREAQNVIKDSATHSIVYLPPEAKDVPSLMGGLCKGISRELRSGAISPLVLAGAFHFEFVTIHPFMDGNGRAARLLTTYLLAAQGYELVKYATIEKKHEADRAKYYSALNRLQGYSFYDIPQGNDIGSWVHYWLECLASACEEARGKIINVSPNVDLTLSQRLQQAIGLFRRHKRLSARDYQQLTGLGRTQAVADLKQLHDQGWIQRKGGGRSTIYFWNEGKPTTTNHQP